MEKGQKISERLRAAILAADVNQKQIARKTGVAASVLSRFVRGEQGITIGTADILASFLGLDLLPVKQQTKGR